MGNRKQERLEPLSQSAWRAYPHRHPIQVSQHPLCSHHSIVHANSRVIDIIVNEIGQDKEGGKIRRLEYRRESWIDRYTQQHRVTSTLHPLQHLTLRL